METIKSKIVPFLETSSNFADTGQSTSESVPEDVDPEPFPPSMKDFLVVNASKQGKCFVSLRVIYHEVVMTFAIKFLSPSS